jgi:hypothetical protein
VNSLLWYLPLNRVQLPVTSQALSRLWYPAVFQRKWRVPSLRQSPPTFPPVSLVRYHRWNLPLSRLSSLLLGRQTCRRILHLLNQVPHRPCSRAVHHRECQVSVWLRHWSQAVSRVGSRAAHHQMYLLEFQAWSLARSRRWNPPPLRHSRLLRSRQMHLREFHPLLLVLRRPFNRARHRLDNPVFSRQTRRRRLQATSPALSRHSSRAAVLRDSPVSNRRRRLLQCQVISRAPYRP